MNNENYTMAMDFYELTMGQTYYKCGKKDEQAYFDVFFRKNPFGSGYTISGGLDNIIDYIKNFKFTNDDINYLRELGIFSEDFLEYLKDLRFTGDIYAIPDGTPVFPNEPIITVKAPIIEAQIIETALLSNFNHGTLVTTASKRITNEILTSPTMEFGLRRAPSIAAGIEASKYAYIGGCAGTSNVYSGKKYGIPVMGTMAHSLIMEADSEYEAFLNYAMCNPKNCIFLVDTYDVLKSGIPNAIRVAKEYLIPNGYEFRGIRIDSGDLVKLSWEAREMLNEAGFTKTGICFSNGLNEYTISTLRREGSAIGSIGAGDNIAAPKERVGGVYKLAAIERDGQIISRIKVSNDAVKTTYPGYKKVYRFFEKETGYAVGDIIALADEFVSNNDYEIRPLQIPIFKNGELVYNAPTVKERKLYCEQEFKTLKPEITNIFKPQEYPVTLSPELKALKEKLILEHKEQEKAIVKILK